MVQDVTVEPVDLRRRVLSEVSVGDSGPVHVLEYGVYFFL